MRLTVVSHSLVAERQWWFWKYFVGMAPDLELQMISPKTWGVHTFPFSEGGYEVSETGNMVHYAFPTEALTSIERFKPDIVYVQNEAYCRVSSQMRAITKRIGAKLVLFVWENINQYRAEAQRVLWDTSLVVCGSGQAEALVKMAMGDSWPTMRCIQVGVDTHIFSPKGRPFNLPPGYDCVFIGRPVPEKGADLIKKAINGTDVTVLWPENDVRVPYDQIPYRFSEAKIHVSPSIDTPNWREQHSSYSNIEALSCGMYVATSDSQCIVEGLYECPGVTFSKQNDHEDLRFDILALKEDYRVNGPNLKGREWVSERYGNDAISNKLLEAFRSLL